MEHPQALSGSSTKRKRKKVRIRYRERVPIKERPRGFWLKRFLRKHWKAVAFLVLLSLVATTVVVIGPSNVAELLREHWYRLMDWLDHVN